MKKNLILLGAPGSGKGTQSKKIINNYNYFYISPSNIIKENILNNNKYGLISNFYSIKGKLVPNRIINKMVINYFNNNTINNNLNIIWDGYPRTVNQFKKLKKFLFKLNLKIDYILNFKIDEKKIIKRIINRLVCSKCDSIYNNNILKLKPKKYGICDYDNYKLIKRKDDMLDKIKIRLKLYNKNNNLLLSYFFKKKIFFNTINADMSDDLVWKQIIKIIG